MSMYLESVLVEDSRLKTNTQLAKIYTKSDRAPLELVKKLREEWEEERKTEGTFSIGPSFRCPSCGAHPSKQTIENYDMMWHDGDIYCSECGGFVRFYDAG